MHRLARPLSFLVFAVLFVGVLPASAQDDAPFPEYPAFKPETGPMAHVPIYDLVLLDLFEMSPAAADVPARLEGFYRIGNDYTNVYLKTEAEALLQRRVAEGEVQALYSRLVTSYFEAQAGLRVDVEWDDGELRARPQLAVGLEGLAPYWFEVEPALFLSSEGDVSARLEGSYDLLITQRLVLQPEAEATFALQEVPDWGVGSGLNAVEAGLRLRYEVRREVAPYVGVSWHRRFGRTADLARTDGDPTGNVHIVAGLRLWW